MNKLPSTEEIKIIAETYGETLSNIRAIIPNFPKDYEIVEQVSQNFKYTFQNLKNKNTKIQYNSLKILIFNLVDYIKTNNLKSRHKYEFIKYIKSAFDYMKDIKKR